MTTGPVSAPDDDRPVTVATGTHWGTYQVTAENGRITTVDGHPADPDPSPIGQALRAATDLRVERPVVRRSWLDNGPGANTDLRGREPFVEVDWDRAIDLVAAELDRVRNDHGNQAIYGGSYGWGSSGRFHQPSNQIYRFLRLFGGYTDARGTYSSSAAETIVPHVLGMSYHAAVAQQTSWSVIAEHTELFVSFGGLRLTNAQVTFGGSGPHHTREWLERCRQTRFLSIAPLGDDDADFVDRRWLPIRPGTDVALMAGLLHTLVVEDLADQDFLDRYCHGWDRLRAYLLGQADGPDGRLARSAAWASGICGIDEATIVALARDMASRRTLISLSLSIQRGDHGEQPYWMAAALAAAVGGIGRPGEGLAMAFGANGNAGAGQRRKRIPGPPIPRQDPDMPVISVSRVVELLENPGREFHFDGVTDTFPDIKLVYWVGGNVFHHHQDLNRLVRAWQRPETIVVHEPFWTPMARFADVVLPATTPLERTDLGGAETVLVAMGAAIEPQGQARNDYDIFAALAERLGFGPEHTQGRSADEWVRHLYEEFRADNDQAPPYEQFVADGSFLHPDMASMGVTRQVFLEDFRTDPDANPLSTPSGRIELWSEVIEAFGYDDCPPHPTWLEPYERLGTEAAEAHPLHLVSNQPATRLHSQFDHGEPSRAAKVADREPARLHPDDAAARGIADGDVIRVFNDRGACLAGAVLSDRVMPGVVQLSTGAWYDPDEPGPDGRALCKHGNPNVLTRDKGTSRLAQGPTAHTCLVEVERYEGEPPPVTAFDPPEIIRATAAPSAG